MTRLGRVIASLLVALSVSGGLPSFAATSDPAVVLSNAASTIGPAHARSSVEPFRETSLTHWITPKRADHTASAWSAVASGQPGTLGTRRAAVSLDDFCLTPDSSSRGAIRGRAPPV